MTSLSDTINGINAGGWVIIAGSLCAVAAALPGCFLVLRRLSMLGDAISHAILPGLAVAFLVSGTRNSLPMFVGAVVVGLLTALLTESIRRYGNVDEGASMGVVFTSLFALGLLLIVQAADHVDLDPGCVLYGSIELTALDMYDIAGARIPRVVLVLTAVLLINVVTIALLYKEFKIAAFDPALATSSGMNASIMHYILMAIVAVTAVACFESVGNVLVVAMFVVPPATAYLLTDRLSVMLVLASLIAVASATVGYWSADAVPGAFGMKATNTAGMMAVCSGIFFAMAALFAPQHGVLAKFIRRVLLSQRILADDILGSLYRVDERQSGTTLSAHRLAERLFVSPLWIHLNAKLFLRGQVQYGASGFSLTEAGQEAARSLIRSHRLWEQYLTEQAGVASDRLHMSAERLEHFTSRKLRDQLDAETTEQQHDPHGRTIPPESVSPESDDRSS